MKIPSIKNGFKSANQSKGQRPISNSEKKTANNVNRTARKCKSPLPEKISWNVLDLKKENYFSCAVGRTQTNARFTLPSSDEVAEFLKKLAHASSRNY